jgi:predicted lipoprotein
MMRAMRLFLFAAVVLSASVPSAHAGTDHSAIAEATLTEVVRPGYAALVSTTGALDDKVGALCEDPSPEALDAAKKAFAATVRSWSQVEILRFGPVNREHRYERMFYWPDPKGIGLRQVQKVLREKDETAVDPASLADKSVALQGLPALEYLLYGSGSEALAESGGAGAFRCRFAASIAMNMANIAGEVQQAWSDDAPFTKMFLGPSPNDPLYRAPKDVTLELSKVFSGGIELVRDQKLGKPLGTSIETAQPRLAAFWRSGLTFPNMVGNLEGVRTLFTEGGFSGVVAQESPGVEDSILFDLNRVIKILAAVDEPITDVVRDSAQRNKLEALRVALKSARETGAGMIAQGAGLSFGFNATDGD